MIFPDFPRLSHGFPMVFPWFLLVFPPKAQVRFPALVPHGDGTFTRFLALERCRGGREFLQAGSMAGDYIE